MNKDELFQTIQAVRETACKNEPDARKRALIDEAMKVAVNAVVATVVNRPETLYAIENVATGEIIFNARGGCYKTYADAEKKLNKMGAGYRIAEYRLKSV